jgi:hypothetical protein
MNIIIKGVAAVRHGNVDDDYVELIDANGEVIAPIQHSVDFEFFFGDTEEFARKGD